MHISQPQNLYTFDSKSMTAGLCPTEAMLWTKKMHPLIEQRNWTPGETS